MPRHLSAHEKEALWTGLNCRKNIIETGEYTIGAEDVAERGVKRAAKDGILLKPLSTDQMKLVILSKELMQKIINGKVYIED